MFAMQSYDLMKLRLEEATRRAEHSGRHAHELRRARAARKSR